MFGFLKRKLLEMNHDDARSLYRVEYIPTCKVANGKCGFQMSDMTEVYVLANGIIDAGVEFAKHHVLSPHLCIFKISRCDSGCNPRTILNQP